MREDLRRPFLVEEPAPKHTAFSIFARTLYLLRLTSSEKPLNRKKPGHGEVADPG
jgi:hypothetical protein